MCEKFTKHRYYWLNSDNEYLMNEYYVIFWEKKYALHPH